MESKPAFMRFIIPFFLMVYNTSSTRLHAFCEKDFEKNTLFVIIHVVEAISYFNLFVMVSTVPTSKRYHTSCRIEVMAVIYGRRS
jgi:hypothetical protein